MAHSDNIISSIKLPSGTTYEIHDAQAIHDVSELGLSAAMVFMGTKATVADLPSSGNKQGNVWYVTEDDCEYVWTENSEWEALGNVHDAASSTHTHAVTVTGTNAASSVTGSVTVPSVSRTQKYLTATAGTPGKSTTTATVLTGFGTHTTATVPTALTTTTVKNPSVSAVTIPNVTGNEEVTASKVSVTGVSIPNVTGNTSVSIPNVTGNTSVTASKISANTSVTASKVSATAGTAASWGASVSNGVLSFSWETNTPTAVSATDVTASKVTASDVTATNTTLGTALSASKVTLGAAISASQVTASDVTASLVTLGDDLSASKVTTSNVTVATGAFKSTATPITALGTATTETALTGVTLSAPAITLTEADSTSTGAVPVVSAVSIGSTSATVSGTAAAQTWTQKSGVTEKPQ